MTTQAKTNKARKRYSQEYKNEALALGKKLGISTAAKQLGLHESQLYYWRSKARLDQTSSERENQLQLENARLKKQLAMRQEELEILKKAAAYFAKDLK